MSANLLKIFTPSDFKNAGKKPSELVELSFRTNKVSGESFARAVFADGTFLVKSVLDSGKVIEFSAIASTEQRNKVIEGLYETYTQLDISAILDISQATVSAVIHNSKRKEN